MFLFVYLFQVPLVRMHAVAALEHLQEDEGPECPMTKTLVWLMKRDTSPDVRRCVLNTIIVTNCTLSCQFDSSFFPPLYSLSLSLLTLFLSCFLSISLSVLSYFLYSCY